MMKRDDGEVVKSLFDEHELVCVDLAAWPVLRQLAGNRRERWIPGADALALYEQVAELRLTTPGEVALLAALRRRYRARGGGRR